MLLGEVKCVAVRDQFQFFSEENISDKVENTDEIIIIV